MTTPNIPEWVVQALHLRQSGVSWAEISRRVGRDYRTIKLYVDPLLDPLEPVHEAPQPEPGPTVVEDVLDRLPMLTVLDDCPTDCDGEEGHIHRRGMRPDELPDNVEVTAPWPVFLYKALSGSIAHSYWRPVAFTFFVLAVMMSFAQRMAGDTLMEGLLAYAAAVFITVLGASRMAKTTTTMPARLLRLDSYGEPEIDDQAWWRWDAMRFPDSIKMDAPKRPTDRTPRRLIYLDAMGDVVRVFNPHAAPVPDGTRQPYEDGYEVTPEDMADIPGWMKDAKDEVQDTEPAPGANVTLAKYGIMIGAAWGAVYWAVVTLQNAQK